MNSREVIDGLLRKKKVERMGVDDSVWGDTLQTWVQEGYPVNANGDPVDPTDHFKFDLCAVGGFFDVMPLRGVLEIVEESDEWLIRRNGAGALLKWWKGRSGTPEHIGFRMTSREAWERDYRPHLLEVDPERLNQKQVDIAGKLASGLDIEGTKQSLSARRAQGLWTYYGHWFIWANMLQCFGDTCMYVSLLSDPDWIHDYNRVYTDFYKAHFKLLIDTVGVPDGFWIYEDLGYRSGLICAPQTLEELFLPYYKEIVDFLHSYEVPVVLHSCGGISDALPLIVEAGFDGLNPMEAKAGCDVLKFAERYGDRLAFIGGLDARVLESGDRALIRKKVTALLEGIKSLGARYVFGSDHSISTNVRYADFQYALEVYREHMMY